ncbi:MAG: DUF6268 family outer membrane beta-barrel protein [Pirellulales bacterium]|nr:DUF6268 family outer membrane beta-barrel protein [Pirellulales bacterium]
MPHLFRWFLALVLAHGVAPTHAQNYTDHSDPPPDYIVSDSPHAVSAGEYDGTSDSSPGQHPVADVDPWSVEPPTSMSPETPVESVWSQSATPSATAVVMPDYVLIQEASATNDPLLLGSNTLYVQDFDITESDLPGIVRQELFQGVKSSARYLPDWNSSGFTQLELENSATLAMPFPDWNSALLVSPNIDAYLLSGPEAPDLPPGLYGTSLEVRYLRRLSDRITLNSSVKPGWFSDFRTNSTQAIRAPAQSFIIYDISPQWEFIAGLVYLDRDDVNFLPAIGFIWTPSPNVRIEAMIPRPGAFFRFRQTSRFDDWLAISGEFGGGQWAIERADGRDDVLSAQDYRLVAGIERRSRAGGMGWVAEAGYVFARKYQYQQTGDPDYEPADTVLLRLGVNY